MFTYSAYFYCICILVIYSTSAFDICALKNYLLTYLHCQSALINSNSHKFVQTIRPLGSGFVFLHPNQIGYGIFQFEKKIH